MDRRRFCFTMLSVPGALRSMPARALAGEGAARGPAVWDSARRLRFVLSDPLEHPFYWWPRTLLQVPVVFEQPVDLDQLRLVRSDTGERVALQFSDVVSERGRVRSATLHFFSDLPSGGRREFALSRQRKPSTLRPEVSEHVEGKTIVLDSGALQVRIPATQTVVGDAPGPILQLARSGAWFGSSKLNVCGDNVTQLTTQRVAAGPLFIAYRLTYETAGGSRYVATVQLNGGMEFVRLHENMEEMKAGARGEMVSTWTDLGLTHRQAANHPYPTPPRPQPYDEYLWERIDEPSPPRSGVLEDGVLPFVVGQYQPWAPYRIGTFVNFWNEHSSDALALFIDRAGDWQDHEYANEISSPALEVSFHARDEKFEWRWPLVRGSRSTCLAFYDHAQDREAMHRIETQAAGVTADGVSYKATFTFSSHALFLQNRYGSIDLDLVKDWVLDYPREARRPAVVFATGDVRSAGELEKRILTSAYACALPCAGTRQNAGFSPVPTRQVQRFWIDGFNRLEATLTERQRRRLTAMFLLLAYVTGGEEFMPLITMVSGHPNFLADVKSVPAGVAFLFPQHPMAATWADLWESAIRMTTRYNTRPAVKAWDATGGRWTENLGTYVWAFLRPSLRAAFLTENFDGQRRFFSPQIAELAEWLTNALSAPFAGESEEAWHWMERDGNHEWGTVSPGHAPVRVHLPLGAHSDERIPPRSMWYLGSLMRNYAPMAAEHAMWAARPTNQDMETAPGPNAWDAMYTAPDNRGTDPHLESRKHTGYGMVLRAAVGTPQEISVHLQQIDEGPNYRWGRSAEGGCGELFFYAAGKAWSFTGEEDVGDRDDQDTDFSTNFGVYKDGFFRSIGMNVLTRPMYNLGAGQFAEIVPRQAPDPYSVPEYVSRSVLLAGHDYFVLTDRVQHPLVDHRFSWFVRRGSEFPTMCFVRAGDPNSRQTKRSEIATEETRGIWMDGEGDSMVVISHRKDITAKSTRFGCTVHAPDVDDLVFHGTESVRYHDADVRFEGMTGLVRRSAAGTEFALFHGSSVGVGDLTFHTQDTDLGIGGAVNGNAALRGMFVAPRATEVTIEMDSAAAEMRVYLDGGAVKESFSGGRLTIELPPGRHAWEITNRLPVPMPPRIVRTENIAGGARVVLEPVASATRYRMEISADNGISWRDFGTHGSGTIELHGLENGRKVHVRAVAKNSEQESAPGAEYPVYVSDKPPAAPDGLSVALRDGAAILNWGEVLGVQEYRLYARARGQRQFGLLYRGLERTYIDRRAGIRASAQTPAADAGSQSGALLEYVVTAVNGNGESAHSRAADSDPASWRNWDPRPGERFRRVHSYPSDEPQPADSLPRYYPD